MSQDPRLSLLNGITTSLSVQYSYDPHYANIAERIMVENILFLARYDALVKFYNEQVVEPTTLMAGSTLGKTTDLDNVVIPIYGVDPKPIDMILFCPNCGLQHIDAPEDHKPDCAAILVNAPCNCDRWDNPPHKSHFCGYCEHIWRPADVPTNGVLAIKTIGMADNVPALRQVKPLDRFRPQWQHNKHLTVYRELGRGELQVSTLPAVSEGARLVAYQGEDNRIWFRLESEFEDGRFTKI